MTNLYNVLIAAIASVILLVAFFAYLCMCFYMIVVSLRSKLVELKAKTAVRNSARSDENGTDRNTSSGIIVDGEAVCYSAFIEFSYCCLVMFFVTACFIG